MAGKSTYIRQAALITIMAQMGSFVPAKEALIGIADRVFARVGASDELARGQSTFMVEMTETARILNSATDRSLVILDEIGRGTSTYDGISLAWAITEHLHDEVQCRTMFATHYHELTDLTTTLKHAANWNVAVQESNDDVVFLHRIVEGAAGRSYGIHVAKIAGSPSPRDERATTTDFCGRSSKLKGHHVAGTLPPEDPLTDRTEKVCRLQALQESTPRNSEPKANAEKAHAALDFCNTENPYSPPTFADDCISRNTGNPLAAKSIRSLFRCFGFTVINGRLVCTGTVGIGVLGMVQRGQAGDTLQAIATRIKIAGLVG